MELSTVGLTLAAAVVCGLDRTAAGQFMLSRPIVAAPLTGWLLGSPEAGLQIGAMLELFWLGRLPVGSAIPPDDSQVAVGCTLLALVAQARTGMPLQAAAVAGLLLGMPFGKTGQFFDRQARILNAKLLRRVEKGLENGCVKSLERWHLLGLLHFTLASVATLVAVVVGGLLLLPVVLKTLEQPLTLVSNWLWLLFPLTGIGSLLGGLKVPRGWQIFCASFVLGLFVLMLR